MAQPSTINGGKPDYFTRKLRQVHALLSEPYGVQKVDATPGVILITFRPNPPIDPMQIIELVQKNRHVKLAGNAPCIRIVVYRDFPRSQVRYQRAMSRKVKFSSNWKKAKARVQRLHARIGNVRRDYLHQATSAISQNHAMVCIEDLQVRNMSKSAVGSAEQPGKQVRAKSGLNKAILDQGWFEFRRQLDYKLAWNGGLLIAVPPQNTSRTCPACGHVSADNRRTQARFACVQCGYEENADVVGAINILARGHRVAACGEAVSQARPARARRAASVKQEPTEATDSGVMPIRAVGIPCL